MERGKLSCEFCGERDYHDEMYVCKITVKDAKHTFGTLFTHVVCYRCNDLYNNKELKWKFYKTLPKIKTFNGTTK